MLSLRQMLPVWAELPTVNSMRLKANVCLFIIKKLFSEPHIPVRTYLCFQAGLLTFPSLLYLPDILSVALYKQTSLRRITAAGTVPDSHRIPLHHGGYSHQIAFLACKVTTFFDSRCIIHGFFLILHQIHVMMTPKTAIMIAAPTSGSGKTTIARGLMALFTQKGYKVQPFKCGPDYIDTKFHKAVCGRPSVNLDTFMASKEHVQALFARYGTDADICIVEGMMGLFDGYDRDKGSSAEIAATLGIPVALVVDAKSAAYSMAPLLQGFINFRKDLIRWDRRGISVCFSRCVTTLA